MKPSRITACAFLRCKNDAYEHPFAQETDSMTPRIYWCGKTFKAFGPDDGEVGIAECQPGRECHSESVCASK